jgi:hypothetical protein
MAEELNGDSVLKNGRLVGEYVGGATDGDAESGLTGFAGLHLI